MTTGQVPPVDARVRLREDEGEAMLALWITMCAVAAVGFRRYPSSWCVRRSFSGSPCRPSPTPSSPDRCRFVGLAPVVMADACHVRGPDSSEHQGCARRLRRQFLTYLGLALFLLVALLTSRTNPTGGGTVLIIDQMLVPILMFMLCCIAFAERARRAQSLRNLIIALAAVESVLALIQWLTDSVLIYQPYYEKQDWWDPANSTRWMGTLEHPLTLSLVLCAAVPAADRPTVGCCR